eukprot:9481460-Pyramimonas_sp.AAC.1
MPIHLLPAHPDASLPLTLVVVVVVVVVAGDAVLRQVHVHGPAVDRVVGDDGAPALPLRGAGAHGDLHRAAVHAREVAGQG